MSITLTVYPLRSPIDAGRNIARIHPAIMDELGLDSWTPVKLTGARTTGALSAPAPTDMIPGACLIDALTAMNAGAVSGKTVLAERLVTRPAKNVVIATPHGLEALPDPKAITHALLGKIVHAGDRISLLPQDFVRPEGSETELQSLMTYLAGVLGPGWQDVVLTIVSTDPTGGVHVSIDTATEWGMPLTETAAEDLEGLEMVPARGLDILMASNAGIPSAEPAIGADVFGPSDVDPFGRGIAEPAPRPMVAGFPGRPGGMPGSPMGTPMVPAPGPAPDLYASALANAGVRAMDVETETPPRLEDLGGMADPIRSLREWFDVSFRQTEMLARLNISPLDGVLLHGLPGTGKSTLIRAVAAAEGAELKVIEGRRFARTDPTSAAKRIREIFRSASAPPPQIIVIENVEELAPAPDDQRSSDTPLTSILLEELKAASARPAVAVVGITSHPERTSPELRGAGLLDHALEIPPPTEAQRREILAIHTRSLPISPDVSLDELARRSPGFVGADIQMLCRLAGVNAVIRLERMESGEDLPPGAASPAAQGEAALPAASAALAQAPQATPRDEPHTPDRDTQPIVPPEDLAGEASLKQQPPVPPATPEIAKLPGGTPPPVAKSDDGPSLLVTMADFEAALEKITPTAMVDASLTIAKITFDDVGNMAQTKASLQEAVIWPIRFPDTFARLGLKPSRGVLLYGPPGCGKTFLVKALANEAEANFLAVKGAELLSKWVGESERGVRELFHRARAVSPSIVFFDEIDALAPTRGASIDAATDRVVAQLLTELDGIEELKDVWVIAATNRPDMVDAALVRPGRLDRMIYVPPPDESSRHEILKATCSQMPVAAEVDLGLIAKQTEGFSGADLSAVARHAGIAVIRRDVQATTITGADFDQALDEVRPSLDRQDLKMLEEFAAERSGA